MASASDRQVPAVPAIPASAGALIFDRAGRLLILKPTYKPGWTIPGGIMEANGETPWQACRREVAEECGIDVRSGRLACVDFRPRRPGKPGGIRFLFDCGTIDQHSLAAIVLQPDEISEYRLVALPLLRGRPDPAAGASGVPRPGTGLPGRRPPGARGRQTGPRRAQLAAFAARDDEVTPRAGPFRAVAIWPQVTLTTLRALLATTSSPR